MLSRRKTFGHFVASYCCGIVAGVAPLWGAEGSKAVAVALNDIWNDESTRPDIILYDLACRRRRYLLSNPDEGWDGIMNYVATGSYFRHGGLIVSLITSSRYAVVTNMVRDFRYITQA